MKTTLKVLCIIIACCNITYSVAGQKQGNIWYFGNNAGLDFSSGSPVALTDGALATNEGCATVCDPGGHLLFYTDGSTIYNKNHAVMMNGTGLMGNTSTTQSAIIVPQPGSTTMFYIFTVTQTNPSALRYSTVNMAGDGGLGQVVTKNTAVITSPGIEENVCAIQGSNMYWIVAHRKNSNIFHAYRLTSSGFNGTPVNSTIGVTSDILSEPGYMKSNLNGTKLAIAYYQKNRTEIFDFNNTTGVLSNSVLLTTYRNYGIEFSPGGQFLYAHAWGYGTYQYNLLAGNAATIQSSRIQISTNLYEGALQLAVDGKIYLANNGNGSISVINNPDELGVDCQYSYATISLAGRTSNMGLPSITAAYLSILPTKLLYFNARTDYQKIHLMWQIDKQDDEHNYFIVERSSDGKQFHPLDLSGKEMQENGFRFSFIDNHPAPGKNYYRLKQVDRDGKITVLGTRIAHNQLENKISWTSISPGSISLKHSFDHPVSYILFSIDGRVIKKGTLSGSNSTIDNLCAGTFVLQFPNRESNNIKCTLAR